MNEPGLVIEALGLNSNQPVSYTIKGLAKEAHISILSGRFRVWRDRPPGSPSRQKIGQVRSGREAFLSQPGKSVVIEDTVPTLVPTFVAVFTYTTHLERHHEKSPNENSPNESSPNENSPNEKSPTVGKS